MAEVATPIARGEQQQQQQRERRKLSRVLLTCFSAPASYRRTQELRSSESSISSTITDEDDVAATRRRRLSSSSAVADDKPLRRIAEAFKDLANVVTSDPDNTDVVQIDEFSRACSYVGTLFGCIGFHFKFIELDYLTKVNDIAEASKTFRTLGAMVDKDMQNNTVRKQGGHSRNLLKIKRGLDFVRVLFHQILLTEGNSVREAVQKAYIQIFQSHHGWALRKAVSSRVHYVPTKQQLYSKVNEDESEAKALMQAYVMASPPLLQYIENIFLSRQLGIDW